MVSIVVDTVAMSPVQRPTAPVFSVIFDFRCWWYQVCFIVKIVLIPDIVLASYRSVVLQLEPFNRSPAREIVRRAPGNAYIDTLHCEGRIVFFEGAAPRQ